jgi:hypothetical protein
MERCGDSPHRRAPRPPLFGLLLLGVIAPTHGLAAARDQKPRVVPRTIHDRALAEGEVSAGRVRAPIWSRGGERADEPGPRGVSTGDRRRCPACSEQADEAAPVLSLFASGDGIVSSSHTHFAVASGTSMGPSMWPEPGPSSSKPRRPRVDETCQALTGTGLLITDGRDGAGTTRPRIHVDLALSALLNPGGADHHQRIVPIA